MIKNSYESSKPLPERERQHLTSPKTPALRHKCIILIEVIPFKLRDKLMNITLKPEQEKFLQEKLKSGKYNTIDEVVIEAFRLLEERDSHYEKWLEETRKKVAVGIEQLERGEGIDSEIVIAKLKEKIRTLREAQP